MAISWVSKVSTLLLTLAFLLPISSARASVATSESLSTVDSGDNSEFLTALPYEDLLDQSPVESVLDAPLAIGQLVGRSGASSDPASLGGLANSVSSPAGSSASASTMPTDFDLDGKVGQSDYQIWRTNFNPTTTHYGMPGDANSDGYISAIDFVLFRDTLGASSGTGPEEGGQPLTAPEPAHAVLFMFSLIAVSCLFRRDRA